MCSKCMFLDEKKKKKGRISGCKYFCKKKKDYINGSTLSCSQYQKNKKRNDATIKSITQDGKKYDNNPIPFTGWIIISGILFILGLILGIFE